MLVYYVGYGFFANHYDQFKYKDDNHIALVVKITFGIYNNVFEIAESVVKQLNYTGTAIAGNLEITNHEDAAPTGELKNFLATHFENPCLHFYMTNGNKDRLFVHFEKGKQHYQLDEITKLSILDDATQTNLANQLIVDTKNLQSPSVGDLVQPKKLKSQKQCDAILEAIKQVGYDPMAIPDGGKSKLESVCRENDKPKQWLFGETDSTSFENAWRKGNKTLFKMANYDGFAKNH